MDHSAGNTVALIGAGLFSACIALTWLSCATTGSTPSGPSPEEPVGAPPADDQPSSTASSSPDAGAPNAQLSEGDDATSGRDGTLWYRIEFSGDEVAIRVRLLAPPDTATLFFPRQTESQSSRAATRDLQLENVRGPDGPLEHTFDGGEGKISVRAGDADWLEVSYRLPTPEAINGVHWLDPADSLLVPSRQVADPIRDIPVELYVPDGWRSSSTWSRRETRESTSTPDHQLVAYVADTLNTVRDAFLAVGPDLHRIRSGRGADSITTAFDNSLGEETARTLHTRIADFSKLYRQQFGHVGDITAFIRAGQPFEGYHVGSGRRGGFVLEVPPDDPTGARATTLIGHETLHVWNGHYLVPADGAPLDWFVEGITHYLAVTLAARHGLLATADGRRELSDSLQAYRDSPIGRDDGAVTSMHRQRFPYDRGVVAGLAIDAALAGSGPSDQPTAWTLTLRRLIDQRGDDPDARVDLQQIESTLLSIADNRGRRASVDTTWRQLVDGRGNLPVDEIATRAGIPLGDDRGGGSSTSTWPFGR